MSAPLSRSQELGGLAGHQDGFVRAVREAGIPVGISQAVDAAEILTVVDLHEREQLRHGLAAVLLARPFGDFTALAAGLATYAAVIWAWLRVTGEHLRLSGFEAA